MRSNLFLIGLGICQIGFGLTSDKNKTAHISADRVHYSQKTGVSIYYGHVQVNQGTTHLRGDKMIVYSARDGKTAEKMIATGHLAEYSTLPDNQKEPMQAQAQKIEYYPLANNLILIGEARAVQNKNVVTGAKIEYKMDKQVVISSPPENKRTVIVIQP